MTRKGCFSLLLFLLSFVMQAQVNWLSFEQLDSALQANPKPGFIEFYTDWCTFCKKMDQEVFTDSGVVDELNTSYYALRFDAESSSKVQFDGMEFIKPAGQRFHQLAMALASEKNEFAPPVLIFLNKDFVVVERIFSYQSRKQLLKKLNQHH